MLDLKLDSKNHTISMTVQLVGEDKPLTVNIGNYNLSYDNGKHFLQVKNITTSKSWLNVLASEMLSDNKIEIPSKIAKVLEVIA